jgi:DNA replication protein DnaC
MTAISPADIPFLKGMTDDISLFADRKAKKDDLPLARDVLVKLMLDAALSSEQKTKLIEGEPMTLVVEPPSAQWISPVQEALDAFGHDTLYTVARGHVPKDVDDPHIARFVGDGRAVVGVSHIPDRALPPTLLALADARIKLPPPDAPMVAETMRRCLRGHIPLDAHSLNYAMLGFDELIGCMVRGSSPINAVEKMRRLIAAKTQVGNQPTGLPKLEDAIEYGAARDFALALRDDIRDYKDGKLGWDAVDRGAIFHGPPGTGKTLLARMLGEACGVPTVITSVAEYFATSAGYLDSVIKAQRKAFEEARQKAPCILFLDELNALPNIDTVGQKNRDYWVPVILDFYQLLDGAMADREGIVVIGATNRLQDIHPALLRPGRFERAIHIGPPDAKGVERIMRHHLGDDLKGDDITLLARIAATHNVTGADIMEKIRASRRVARRAGRLLEVSDLEAQVSPAERRTKEQVMRIATHEAGHALVAATLGVHEVRAITTIDSGNAAGLTEFSGQMIRSDMTRQELEQTCMIMLAGRAAEQLIFGEAAGGSGGGETSDLGIATRIMGMMIGGLGMGEGLAYRTDYEDALAVMRIDGTLRRQVEERLADLQAKAMAIVTERETQLRDLADEVVKRRYMTGDEIRAVLANSESVVELEVDSAA